VIRPAEVTERGPLRTESETDPSVGFCIASAGDARNASVWPSIIDVSLAYTIPAVGPGRVLVKTESMLPSDVDRATIAPFPAFVPNRTQTVADPDESVVVTTVESKLIAPAFSETPTRSAT
jgi:hypothetical protein